MKKKNSNPEESAKLRQRAEEKLNTSNSFSGKIKSLSRADALKLIHELEVHQIELELQNEELIIAKEQAKLAEEKYIELYDYAPCGYLSISKTGEILELNFAAAHILGKERSKLINKRFEFFVSIDTQTTFSQFIKKTFTNKAKQTCEVVIASENNLPIYVNIDGILSQNEEFCLLTLTDISEKTHAQQNVFLSEIKYKAAFQTSPDAVNINKLNGEYVEINEGFTRLTGFTDDDVIGRLSTELDIWAIPEDRKKLIEGLKKVGIVENLETVFRAKDGRLIPGLMSAKLFNLNQEPHILSVTRDITEQKKYVEQIIHQKEEYEALNEELRQTNEELFYSKEKVERSEEKYRAVFDKSLVSIVIADDKGNYLSANDAACKLFGYSLNEILKMNISDLKTIIKPGAEQRYNEYLRKGEVNGEFDFITKTGEPKIAFYQAIRVRKNFNLSMLVDITKQKDTEKEILIAKEKAEVSEEKTRLLIELAAEAFLQGDKDGNIILVNKKAIEMFMYSKEELLTLNIKDLFPLEILEAKPLQYDLLKTGKSVKNERKIKRKNGEIIYVEMNSYAMQDGTYQSFIRDITERKQAEEKLIIAKEKAELSELHFKALIENAPDGVVVLDAGGNFIYGSPNAARHFGYTENEVLGHSGNEYTHPDDIPLILKTFETIFNNPSEKPKVTYRFKHKNGEYRWIETTFTNLLSDKAINGIVLNFTDITERKQMLEDLVIAKDKAEKSEEQFNLAMKASNDGIFDWNLETNEIYYSPGWKKMLGYEDHELPNDFSVWEKATQPEDVNKAWELQQKLIAKQTDRFVMEFKMKHKNGHWVDILSRAEAFFNDSGKAIRIVGTHTDISERKQAEKERQEKIELEKKIQLTEESLRFKQNFLANMSHEIRTPLTGILGMAEILSKTKLDIEQTDYLNTILNSGENLREIINNVLDFSKIEAGKLQLKKRIFPLQNLFDTAESLFKSTCKKPIVFKYSKDTDLPLYIKSDENRIKQIINNIVSNAVKFTSKGEIHLQAQLLFREPDMRSLKIKISISDTGVGIPEYLHEKLFQPFSQIDNRDTRQFEGSGLGLSICKNLVMMLDGEIGLQSSPNKGSTFWFTFTAEESKSNNVFNANENGMLSKKCAKLRILLVEDKFVNQKVIKLLLNSIGHEVTIADNGEKALEIFDPEKFDLILMDIQMPIMDGITATQILKQKYDSLPPIIGLSANAFEGDREKYIEQGMDGYLTKPLNVDDFMRLIDEML